VFLRVKARVGMIEKMVIYLERTSQKPMDNVYLQYEILIAISRRERLKLLSDDIKKLLLDVKQKLLVPV